MTSPIPLPDWVPWWVHVAVLLLVLLFGILFLLMPFSVFGVKARLEGIEARLDEIQGEIRSLSLRLPEAVEDEYVAPGQRGLDRPPLPPAPRRSEQRPEQRPEPRIVRGTGRTEPRLY